MGSGGWVDVTPSASRLTSSLRDIGYDFVSAIADIVDNSVSAGACHIDILIEFEGSRSRVIIGDDGCGMTEARLNEALRFGSQRDYGTRDLGRFGLGLKTASISQYRRLTVVTRHAPRYRRLAALTLDLDRIERTDRWVVWDPWDTEPVQRSLEWLDRSPGTVVVWEMLDRVLPAKQPDGSWAKRKLDGLAERTTEYLGMVFHRFIEGVATDETITISVNGEKVAPWNPFAPDEGARQVLPESTFEVVAGDRVGSIRFRPVVLPNRDRFSSPEAFERLGGLRRWNRQQGLYIYRADRMIQSGGWSGMRAVDEHTKLARAAVDFSPDLDTLFRINVAKMRVTVPAEIRSLVDRPIHDLCHRADSVYRRGNAGQRSSRPSMRSDTVPSGAALALRAAAMEVGAYDALHRIMERVQDRAPDVAEALGW
jgi:hypothetical protein